MFKNNLSVEFKDDWVDNSQNINVLEAQALRNSLLFLSHHSGSCGVDVHTDSAGLKSDVNGAIKDIFVCCREFNFSLDVHCAFEQEPS